MSKKVRNIVIFIVIAVVLIGGYFFVQQQASASAESEYQTALIERGNLVATVGATGTVRANQTAYITWQTSGMVGETMFNVGDLVRAGDVLAALEKTSLSQNIILAEADLISAQRALDDLMNSNTAEAQAKLALIQAQDSYDDVAQDYEGLDYPRASQTKIDDVKSRLDLVEHQVSMAEAYYSNFSSKPDGDPQKAQALANLTSARLSRDQLRAQYNWYIGKPTDADYADLDAQVKLAEARLADAQREWDRLKDGPDKNDIVAAEARIAAAQATLNMARLTAPFTGTISEAHPMVGDQVSPSVVAYRIDDLSRLFVDVQISEVDINNIQVGQEVSLSFDAILGKTYHGVVTQVGQVGESVGGVVNFTVTVELTDADELVKPGMTAAVNIVVKEIEDVLLVPNRAVRLSEGQRVVYILRDGVLEMVEIRLGSSSDTMSVLASDNLEEGTVIVLNPPTTFGNDGPPFMGR